MRQAARGLLRKHERLRSGVYFTLSALRVVADTPARSRREILRAYEEGPDPWGYDSAWGRHHLDLVEKVVAGVEGADRLGRVLDFGCGEGWYSHRVAPHCHELVAVDLSSVALARARVRCAGQPNIAFRQWDIQRDPDLGRFDMVLAICVLEVLLRPVPRRRARRRLLEMLAPGGYLLVMTTKQSPVVELSRWSGLLVRGTTGIDRFLLASGRLQAVDREESDTHVVTLYRRTGK